MCVAGVALAHEYVCMDGYVAVTMLFSASGQGDSKSHHGETEEATRGADWSDSEVSSTVY